MTRQPPLDFAAAEAVHGGRRAEMQARLIVALRRAGADLHMATLALRIFAVQFPANGAQGGALQKTYGELAARGTYGLWCSPVTAKRAALRLESCGIIKIEEDRYTTGGQKANRFTIDRPVVDDLANGNRPVQTDRPGDQNEPPSTQNEPPSTQNDRPFKETRTSLDPSLPEQSPEGRSPGLGWFLLPDGTDSAIDLNATERLLCNPDAVAAASGSVEALPAVWTNGRGETRNLNGSVFCHLTSKVLRDPGEVLRWHRRQLSATSPVLGASKLDAAMAVACAMYVSRLPEDRVKTSRVAFFNHLILKRKWGSVLRYLPDALSIVLGTSPELGCAEGVSRDTSN